MMHLTHFKLLSIPTYWGPVGMYILRVAPWKLLITDIYEMFILNFRTVEEEVSVSTACGIGSVWWLVLCADRESIVTHTARSSQSSLCRQEGEKEAQERLCWTVTPATECMAAACKMPWNGFRRDLEESEGRIWSVCNNALSFLFTWKLVLSKVRFWPECNKLTAVFNQGIHFNRSIWLPLGFVHNFIVNMLCFFFGFVQKRFILFVINLDTCRFLFF